MKFRPRPKSTTVIILVLILIIAIIVGLRTTKLANPVSLLPFSNPQTPADPKTQLEQFLANFSQIDSYSITVTTASESAVMSVINVSYQQPGLSQTSFDSGNGDTQVITTPEATYLKNENSDTWLQLPSDTQTDLSDVEFNLDNIRQALSSEESLPEYIEQTDCGELRCHIYRLKDIDPTTEILFDTKDFLLRQVIIHGPEQVTIDYNYSPVSITLPPESDVFALPSDPTPQDLETANQLLGL